MTLRPLPKITAPASVKAGEPFKVSLAGFPPNSKATLKLTWMDYPIDNALALYIDESDGGYRFLLVQPAPTGTTDAIAFDRELVLSFSEPISASQAEAFLQEGLDTPG